VSPDIFSKLADMGSLFARNAHARRMAIASMVVGCHGEKSAQLGLADLAQAVMSPELLAIAETGILPAAAYSPIFLSGRSTGTMAGALISRTEEIWAPRGGALKAKIPEFLPIGLALAHPELPSDVFQPLFKARETFPDHIHYALYANCQSGPAGARFSLRHRPAYFLPKCAFGDLNNADERSAIASAFFITGDDRRHHAVLLLLSNSTFNAQMAHNIHDELLLNDDIYCDPQVIRKFLNSEADREYVRSGGRPIAREKTAREVTISPEMHPDEVQNWFSRTVTIPGGEDDQYHAASYLMHECCPDSVFQTLVKFKNPYLGADRFAGSKFDAQIIAGIESSDIPFTQLGAKFASGCPTATDKLLRMAFFNDKHATGIVASSVALSSHNNFAWMEHLREQLHPACMLVEAALRRDVGDSYAKSPASGAEALAAIFTENLSAFRLEKLADAYPALRALAACHPNGGDLAERDNLEHVQVFRKTLLPSTPLTGPHTPVARTPVTGLTL